MRPAQFVVVALFTHACNSRAGVDEASVFNMVQADPAVVSEHMRGVLTDHLSRWFAGAIEADTLTVMFNVKPFGETARNTQESVNRYLVQEYFNRSTLYVLTLNGSRSRLSDPLHLSGLGDGVFVREVIDLTLDGLPEAVLCVYDDEGSMTVHLEVWGYRESAWEAVESSLYRAEGCPVQVY